MLIAHLFFANPRIPKICMNSIEQENTNIIRNLCVKSLDKNVAEISSR